ncbi:MAG: tetratricopeptide repeat protein [Vicinamibacterales bacterium]
MTSRTLAIVVVAAVAGSAPALRAQRAAGTQPARGTSALQAPQPRGDSTPRAPLGANALAAGPGTPAERKIALAKEKIAGAPDHAHGFTDLALALTQRARETADPRYYVEADAMVQKALELQPNDFEALKVRTWALLGQHKFAAALELATALNTRVPDDLMVYGMLTDANIELGRYDEAEASAQWMLDLRPGNIPAFTRTAYLRELFGDLEGALELMTGVMNRMPFQETEDRAWVLTQIGHLELLQGRHDAAEQALQQALALFPDYHYALGGLADVRTAQKRFREAADLQARRYARAPHPENLYELAEAEARAGRSEDAAASYRAFEKGALAESAGDDNANRELIAYYAGPGKKPAEALRIAEREIARRGDVYTRDAYAWALFKNGRTADARNEIAKVLDVGVRHPRVLEHAALIRAGAPKDTSTASETRSPRR